MNTSDKSNAQEGWSEAIPTNQEVAKMMGFAALYPSYAIRNITPPA
jgi:hypothetical protein